MNPLAPVALFGAVLAASTAHANISVFNNQATFLADTGAISATGPLPSLPSPLDSAHIGSVTFSGVDGWKIWVGGLESYNPADWTTLLQGNEIAVNSMENLNVVFDATVFSAGFQFAEPGLASPSSPYAHPAGYPYADSTFTITLKLGASVVDIFTFNAPDETGSFVGVWSDTAFDRMEIRETSGAIEDDYFGEF